MGSRRALVVGINRFGEPVPDGEETPVGDSQLDDLQFVDEVVPKVAAALAGLGYRPDVRWNPDARKLRSAVQDAVGSAPVIYVASHGRRGRRHNRVDVVPSCGRTGSGTSASQWVEDAQEQGEATLFLFDLCHAGRAVENLVHRAENRLSAWVMAACGGEQQAFDGLFSSVVAEVFAQVAADGLGTDPGLPYVRFSEVARQVTGRVRARSHFVQDVVCSALDPGPGEPELPFFPNPNYDPQVTALARLAPSLRGFLNPDDAAHFQDKAGPRFTGRTAQLRLLGPWLDDVEAGGLRVVTGAPGSGKSALLGVLVCAAHPELAHVVPEVRARLSATAPGSCPSVNDRLAAVHARGRTVDEVVAAIARQLLDTAPDEGDTPVDANALVAGLAARPDIPAVVVDAVDEAADPAGVCSALMALAEARRGDGRLALRLLVGARPWPMFAGLWERAQADGGLIDLDHADPSQLRQDVHAYLDAVISEIPAYRPPAMRPIREALARAAAAQLAPVPATAGGVDGGLARAEWGPYLVAAVFSRYLQAAPPPVDPHAAARLGASVPGGLPGVLDMDLAARPDRSRTRAVLAALALARGDGMPREIVLPLAGLLDSALTRGQADEVLDGDALFYLRATPDEHGVLHYRLFHQGLADHLAEHPHAAAAMPAPTPAAVFDHLLTTHVPMDGRRHRRWDSAPGYLLRHALAHARDADRLDDLLTDPEFLTHAQPSALAAAFRDAESEPARFARAVYLTSIELHRHTGPGIRRQLLAIDAGRHRHTALRDALTRDQPWRARWATLHHAPHPALRDTLVGHHGGAFAVACTRVDGRLVAVTSGAEGALRMWDLAEQRPLGDPMTEDDGFAGLVACTEVDGRPVAVATSGADGEVRIWDLSDRRLIGEPRTGHGGGAGQVACTEVGGRPVAVTGSGADGTVRVLDLAGQRPLGVPLGGHQGGVFAVACTMIDGQPFAVTGGADRMVRVWDLTRWREHGEPLRHEDWLGALATTEVGGRPVVVTCGGFGGSVQMWDLADRRPLCEPITGHEGGIFAVACTQVDARPVAVTAGEDGTARVWDVAGQRSLAEPLTGHGGSVRAVACAEVDRRPVAVTVGGDGMVRLWDVAEQRAVSEPVTGHDGGVRELVCAEVGGHPLAITLGGGPAGAVRVWDLAEQRLSGELSAGHDGRALTMACTQVGGRPVVVTCGEDGAVRVWDVAERRLMGRAVAGHNGWVRAVACGTLGGRPVAVTSGADGAVRVWDVTDQRALGEPLAGRGAWVTAMACTQVGGRPVVVTCGNHRIRLWDLAERRTLGEPLAGHEDEIFAVACTQVDGLPVAVTGGVDGLVRVWDLARQRCLGEPLARYGRGWVPAVACTKVGGRPMVVVGGDDGVVTVWDLRTRTVSAELAMPARVTALAFSSSGSLVVGCGPDLVILDPEELDPEELGA